MCVEDDGWRLLQNTVRKAQKLYSCDECGKAIEKGAQYRYVFGRLENETLVFRQCVYCSAIYTSLENQIDLCYGSLKDLVEEELLGGNARIIEWLGDVGYAQLKQHFGIHTIKMSAFAGVRCSRTTGSCIGDGCPTWRRCNDGSTEFICLKKIDD